MNIYIYIYIQFSFQPNVGDGCNDLLQKAMILKEVSVLSLKVSTYRIHFLGMSKDKALNILKKLLIWVVINY